MLTKLLKRKKRHTEKAITLVALVVTIVILLILSGVTIMAIGGNNGVITHAILAKKDTEKAKEIETIGLAFTSAKMSNSYEIEYEKIAEELNDDEYDVSFDGDYYKIISKETQNEYIFDKQGNIKEQGKYYYESDNVISDGNVKINVGDLINYNAMSNENSKYTSNVEKNGYSNQSFTRRNDVKWIVLGINNAGELLITSKEAIKTDEDKYFFLKGQEGFKYGIIELDNICKLYGNGIGAKDSRSIRIDDINKITKYNPMSVGNNQHYSEGNLNEYGNETIFYWNDSTFPYYEAANGVKGNLEQEHNNFYTFNENKNEFTNNEIKTGKMQYISKIKTNFYSYYIDTLTDNVNDSESAIKKFNKAYELISRAGSYWLASKTIETNEDGVYYGIRMYAGWSKKIAAGGFYSSYGNNNDGQGVGVRPVITISNDIRLNGDSTNGWNLEK